MLSKFKLAVPSIIFHFSFTLAVKFSGFRLRKCVFLKVFYICLFKKDGEKT